MLFTRSGSKLSLPGYSSAVLNPATDAGILQNPRCKWFIIKLGVCEISHTFGGWQKRCRRQEPERDVICAAFRSDSGDQRDLHNRPGNPSGTARSGPPQPLIQNHLLPLASPEVAGLAPRPGTAPDSQRQIHSARFTAPDSPPESGRSEPYKGIYADTMSPARNCRDRVLDAPSLTLEGRAGCAEVLPRPWDLMLPRHHCAMETVAA